MMHIEKSKDGKSNACEQPRAAANQVRSPLWAAKPGKMGLLRLALMQLSNLRLRQ
jgi:hypothetical protein